MRQHPSGKRRQDQDDTQVNSNPPGVEIMDQIDAFNQNHTNPYCEATGGHFLLHAQVGIAEDEHISPGTRIPIGEEPDELIDHLLQCAKFHKYFPSGTGDIFPIDTTVHKNPEFVLDIVKGLSGRFKIFVLLCQ